MFPETERPSMGVYPSAYAHATRLRGTVVEVYLNATRHTIKILNSAGRNASWQRSISKYILKINITNFRIANSYSWGIYYFL